MAKALLQIDDIFKRYGARVILDGVTVSFSTDQKVGVIGRNGAGKSTLCKIITGHEEADSGSVRQTGGLRLSYLEQQDPYELDETILDFLVRYTDREEWECGEMAHRFQVTNEMLDETIGSLAGGYRTRVKLAAMLLKDPNFLILDEPTNYLDLSTLILLENFLQDFRGGYLVVSHDREFLKRTCEQTLEVDQGDVMLYPGGIEEYFTFKEEQLRQKAAYNRTVTKKKEQLEAFVNRFKAKASMASRAQSKLKQIGKLKTIEIKHSMSNVRIPIPKVELRSGTAITCDDLSIGYPDAVVASKINIDVDRDAHVAVLGDNGEGKTTFLRTIVGDLPTKGGAFRWSNGLKLGYYAQHVFASLDPSDDVLTYLSRDATDGLTRQDVLDMAGSFLFRGDDVRKKVKVLSGGERSRLVLAGLLLQKCHILLLDEPTNHLDFETVESLGRALKAFGGTLFFISHDRTFVNLVATQIIEVKKGRVSKYAGTYEDYAYHLERVAQGINEEEDKQHKAHEKEHPQAEIAASVKPRQKKAENKKEIAQIREKATKAEKRVKHLTNERDALVKEMQNNPFHFSRDRNDRLEDLPLLIEKEEAKWLNLQSKLDALEN